MDGILFGRITTEPFLTTIKTHPQGQQYGRVHCIVKIPPEKRRANLPNYAFINS